jgi:hypothetical protein
VEKIEDQIIEQRIENVRYDFNSFFAYFLNNTRNAEIFEQNLLLNKMAVFQKRNVKRDCSSVSPESSKFIAESQVPFRCFSEEESKETYGEGTSPFTYQDFPGLSYEVGGRSFSTQNGYYMFIPTGNRTEMVGQLNRELAKGWVDSYTKYVGFIVNMYNPTFDLLMLFQMNYDVRFGFAGLVGGV